MVPLLFVDNIIHGICSPTCCAKVHGQSRVSSVADPGFPMGATFKRARTWRSEGTNGPGGLKNHESQT